MNNFIKTKTLIFLLYSSIGLVSKHILEFHTHHEIFLRQLKPFMPQTQVEKLFQHPELRFYIMGHWYNWIFIHACSTLIWGENDNIMNYKNKNNLINYHSKENNKVEEIKMRFKYKSYKYFYEINIYSIVTYLHQL